MSQDYTFTKNEANIDRLEQEINDEGFPQVLLGSVYAGDQLTICFDAALSAADETTLGTVVANHVYTEPLPAIDAVYMKDGVDPLPAMTGMAGIYIDTNDGNLKIKFSDGVVKTVAVDE